MIATLVVLVLFGLLLIMLEAFVPGGVLGAFGVLCILSAVAVAVFADELAWDGGTRTAVAVGIVLFSVGAVFVWLRFFAVGLFQRVFNLSAVISTPESGASSLVGVRGIALTELRPLGKAQLDSGARCEVRLQHGHAPAGARIQITATEPGNLVAALVNEPDSPPHSSPASLTS